MTGSERVHLSRGELRELVRALRRGRVALPLPPELFRGRGAGLTLARAGGTARGRAAAEQAAGAQLKRAMQTALANLAKLRRRGGPAGVPPVAGGEVTARVEERMALAIAVVRWAMVVLVFAPSVPWLLGNGRAPTKSPLALLAGGAAAAESFWVLDRARRKKTTRDGPLVAGDVAFSLLLMLLVSRSVAPERRNAGLTSSLSFTLVSAGLTGLGLGISPAGATVPLLLALGWAGAVWPDLNVKLISDCLGFPLWYVSCGLIARGFRGTAALADRAQAEAEAAWTTAAEQRHLAGLAREREQAFRAIHDELLPIVDAVAGQRIEDLRLPAAARRAATAARDLILGRQTFPEATLGAGLAAVRDEYLDYGLELSPWGGTIDVEPQSELAQAVVAAAREALRNTHKYAGNREEVTLHVEVTAAGGEISIRDQGAGFDPSAVRGRGGFEHIYRALARWGGDVQVISLPQLERGTEVTISWPAQPDIATQGGRS